ncbi:MAG: DoxX family protein [Aureispira sp.]
MKTLYWSSTLLIVVFLLWSTYTYFFSKSTIEGLKELGFPSFFIMQLGVLQFLAALVLLLPIFPLTLKEWGYAGVGFFLLTAFVAHAAHQDGNGLLLVLLGLASLLALSRYTLTLVIVT